MTPAVVVILVSILGLMALAIGLAFRSRDLALELAEAKADADANAFEVARLTQHAEDLLVPLTWTWDHVEADPVEGFGPRLRAYLVACYLEVQKMVLKDDVEMADVMVEAREHPQPRRLPTRPQVPPFLARPEDVAGVGIITAPRAMTEAEAQAFEREWAEREGVTVRPGLPLHDFDVVTTPQGKPPMGRRYFTQFQHDGPWTEVSHDAAQFHASQGASTYVVESEADPASVPEAIRALIWAPPREVLPQPVALDDEEESGWTDAMEGDLTEDKG